LLAAGFPIPAIPAITRDDGDSQDTLLPHTLAAVADIQL